MPHYTYFPPMYGSKKRVFTSENHRSYSVNSAALVQDKTYKYKNVSLES